MLTILLTMQKRETLLVFIIWTMWPRPFKLNIGQGYYSITVKWWESCQNKVNMKQIRAIFPAALWFHDMPILHVYWNNLSFWHIKRVVNCFLRYSSTTTEIICICCSVFLYFSKSILIKARFDITLTVNQNFNCFCSCDDSALCNYITTQTYNIVTIMYNLFIWNIFGKKWIENLNGR